jgi:Zn-dependent protease
LKTRSWQSAVSLAGPTANLLMAIILAVVLAFAPADALDKNSPWPGIAFLAFLQLSALVLNLIPLPPFDGYGILEPFLSESTRAWVNSVRLYITLFVFLALWNIPFVNQLLWSQVGNLAYLLSLPFDLIQAGFDRFLFWQL